MLAAPWPTWPFTITQPAEQAVLESSQSVPVRLDVGTEIAVAEVRYYWYRLDEEPMVKQQAIPALIATALDDPPYGGSLPIPADAIGAMRLLAVGEVSSGRLIGREEFDEVTVTVKPRASLARIEFESEKPLRLNTLGKIIDLPVVGLFADDVTRPLRDPAAGTTYRSTNERVVTVSPDGALQVVGDGAATVVVANDGRQGALEIIVRTDGEPNEAPIARAGPDQVIKSGAKVVLDGLRSVDPEGDPLRYQWKQVRGNRVALLDGDTPKPTFIAPKVSAKRLLRFRLQVTDMLGPDTVKGADSRPSFVDVWIEP